MKEIDPNINPECAEALDRLNESVGSDGFGSRDFENLVRQYPECEKQLRNAYGLWCDMNLLEKVPPVSPEVKPRFLDMLEEFEAHEGVKTIQNRSGLFITFLKWAAVFVIGVAVGTFISKRSGPNAETAVPPVSNQILASLDSDKPAAEKLKVLQAIKTNPDPEEYVYEALYKTIMDDPNVNVRLSAIEAMLHFSDKPKVRTLLVKALTHQESPIVQFSLAEVIIKLQDRRAIEEIRKLLDSDALDPEVKIHLKESLSQI